MLAKAAVENMTIHIMKNIPGGVTYKLYLSETYPVYKPTR